MKKYPIPNFEYYLITKDGRVYSKLSGEIKEKKAYINCQTGYKAVDLYVHPRRYKRHIHSLVLTTFIRARKRGEECRHLDGNKLNNLVSNLKWGTRKENAADMVKHGRSPKGERCGTSVLKEKDVIKIKSLSKKGMLQKDIAEKFKVCTGTIQAIISARSWFYLNK
jgi:hypothetical protein